MKKAVFLFFTQMFILQGYSQYATPGTGVSWGLDDLVQNSQGAVTFETGAYYLWQDLTVSQSDTVFILDNGFLRIDKDKLITVEGVLLCEPVESFVFTAIDTAHNFKGFRFVSSDGSVFANSVVEFGGGIKLVESDIQVINCIIRRNDKSNCTGAIDIFMSNPVIQNCEIFDNEGPAIQSAANAQSSPLIFQNNIYYNNSTNENMPQVNMGTTAQGVQLKIIENHIAGMYENAGGIAVSTLAGGELNCLIKDNVIENNRYGIAVYGNNIYSEIIGNTITGNDIQNDPMTGGSGITFWGDTTNVSIVKENLISENLWGVTVLNNARPNLGQVESDTINTGENLIFENGNQGTVYALYNNTPGDLYAENNYWGTYNIDTVEMFIFHNPDDPSLGFVDYLPVKGYITGAESVKCKYSGKIIEKFYYSSLSGGYAMVFNDSASKVAKTVSIYNLAGELILSEKTEQNKCLINMSVLRKGVYIVNVVAGDRYERIKFVK